MLVARILVAVACALAFSTPASADDLAPPKFIVPGQNEGEWAKKPAGKVGRTGVDAAGFASRSVGVRPFVADGTSGQGQSTLGILGRERATGLLLTRFVSARYGDELWLGYDGVDFAGRALIDGALGFYLPVARFTGPVARVGLFAEVTQQVGLFKTELQLGTGELGWTYARGASHLDVVLQLGPTLLGQLDLGPLHRSLGGLTWGTSVSAGWEELTLDLRMSQIGQDSAEGPVTDLRGEVCGLLGGRPARPTKTTRGADARPFVGPNSRDFRALLCADMTYGSAAAFATDEASPSAARSASRWTTIGISILIGRATRLDPLPRVGL
jgi:hypothetical protein